jgi:hypothetical protein
LLAAAAAAAAAPTMNDRLWRQLLINDNALKNTRIPTNTAAAAATTATKPQ